MHSIRTHDAPTPTRRTVIRTAAWTVPVISVAATAPAFAASVLPGTTLQSNTPVKWSNGPEKHVSWDLALVNGGVAIDTVSITFSYINNGGGTFDAQSFVIRQFGVANDPTWSKTPTAGATTTITATRTANIAAGATHNLHVDFAGGDNSAGKVSATVTITYVGVPTPTVLNTGSIDWVSGNSHTGH